MAVAGPLTAHVCSVVSVQSDRRQVELLIRMSDR